MEQTVSAWCKNILEADMEREPTQMADGTLRTPGAVDFFRILNEEVRSRRARRGKGPGAAA
jgi:exocyst complex component 3